MTSKARIFLVGLAFGIVLVKSEVASWFRIQRMFRFEEPYMYLVLGSALGVGVIAMALIRRIGVRDLDGRRIVYEPKRYHTGVIVGGALFGMGWAITGACPGPIYAQIGSGEWPALATLGGALIGMLAYAAARPRLPH